MVSAPPPHRARPAGKAHDVGASSLLRAAPAQHALGQLHGCLGRLSVEPHPSDPAPSPILGNLVDVLRHKARILKPMVRWAWLKNSPG